MAKFERSFPLELQEALKKPPLYTECLLRDICSGEVFPLSETTRSTFITRAAGCLSSTEMSLRRT